MGVPLNHPLYIGLFTYKPSILEYPHDYGNLMKPPYVDFEQSCGIHGECGSIFATKNRDPRSAGYIAVGLTGTPRQSELI